MATIRILPVKDSKLVKWKVRVYTTGSSYTKSYHKTKAAATKAANKLRKKKKLINLRAGDKLTKKEKRKFSIQLAQLQY